MATRRQPGRYEKSTSTGEAVSAFIPDPLPPPIKVSAELGEKVRLAEQKLSRLELAGDMVPSIEWFIYAFVRKEAVLSSQIEGTQASLIDLLAYEAGAPAGNDEPTDDVEEVSNYLSALAYTRQQLRSEKGLPLSTRLVNEAHRRLMKGVRGSTKQPGELRRSQNWIAAPARATRSSFPLRHRNWAVSWATSRSTSTASRSFRPSAAPRSCTCNSKPSTPISTATAASGACSSRCCSSTGICFRSHSCI